MPRRTDRVIDHADGGYSRIYENGNGCEYINMNGGRQLIDSYENQRVHVTPSMTTAYPGENYMNPYGHVVFDDRHTTSEGPAYWHRRH